MKIESIKAALFDSFMYTFGVLCGVVYFLAPNEDQLLDLGKNSVITLSLWLLTLLISTFLVGQFKTLGVLLFAKKNIADQSESLPFYCQFWGVQLSVIFLIALLVGLRVTEFSIIELFDEQGVAGARRIFSSLLSPNFEVLPQAVLAIVETIFIAFIATVFAVPVAFCLSFVCAKNIVGKTKWGFALYAILRTILNFSRSIEPLIWAIVFSVWVGIGPFAGMLALLIHSIASLTKNYSELIEGISEGPIEAIQATGARPLQVLWFAVVPQIVLPYTAFTIYRWDINVRMATVIGLVGGGGIGTMLIQYQGQALWHEVGCLVLVIGIVVWIMDAASAYIREAIK